MAAVLSYVGCACTGASSQSPFMRKKASFWASLATQPTARGWTNTSEFWLAETARGGDHLSTQGVILMTEWC
ncbi:hypothetical protein Pr1d_10320 [Bythopirellula goksoeyrii]|uniref:Uncharacterized protein n=1 Tax=Bythopirellula goksoeyrii TaxID=1400387 RepID=A0A5B9Q8K4_9BACT|nr:hypothetical protein Pr1d_10320 [Bythopirellula goksoeyrii]